MGSFGRNGDVYSDWALTIVAEDLERLLEMDDRIDTIVLACTHFSHLDDSIQKVLWDRKIRIIHQGPIVAEALQRYLINHPSLEVCCLKEQQEVIYTTGCAEYFTSHGLKFMKFESVVKQIIIP
jgi:glutamate racemase